jgi:Ca-activated chloride channel family protein
VGAGHGVSALYELELVPGAEATLGWVRVRFRAPDQGEATELARALSRSDLARGPSASLRLAATVAGLAELLQGAAPQGARSYRQLAREAEQLSQEAHGDARIDELGQMILAAAR